MLRRTRHRLAVLVAVGAQALAALSGCGDESPLGASPDAGGTAGSGGTSDPLGAGGSGVGTDDPQGGDVQPGTDTGGTDVPGTEPLSADQLGLVVAAPEFEGIDIDTMPMADTPGCVGGFDPATGVLALTVEPTTSSLVVDAADGRIRANGMPCRGPNGEPAAPSTVTQLTITGTEGNDVIIVDLLAGDFGDPILAFTGTMQIDAGGGTDVVGVRGTRGDDRYGCLGAEGDGVSSIDFGRGAQALNLAHVESILASLGPGNDAFSGSGKVPCSLPLVVYGGAGSDTLQGGAAADILNGGTEGDAFDTGSAARGADIINGGPDEDLVSFARRMHDVNVELCQATSNVGCTAPDCACTGVSGETGEALTIVNVEDAEGGDGDDTLIGNAEANALLGQSGNDRLEGVANTDQLFGGDGDDVLLGGDDDDILSGGLGADMIDGQKGTDNLCLYDSTDQYHRSCQLAVQVKN